VVAWARHHRLPWVAPDVGGLVGCPQRWAVMAEQGSPRRPAEKWLGEALAPQDD